MKKVKYRFYLDFEKEEKWINEMARKGWHLEKFLLGRFTFIKGDPGESIYRNEFITGMSHQEKKEYFEFLKDSGITIVHEFGGWVYMKKAAVEGPFEIYTDTKSKIDYYKRILNIFLLLFFLNVSYGIMNMRFYTDYSSIDLMTVTVGVLNIAVALLIAVPIVKIMKRKKGLEEEQQFFE
ncbi:DUF2812 domain-containing protein [Rummeliibacillus stabekisii]|uniref:DUF2812 domain-containing protein n=1 Tax=Rummeliibacillus stabekisii TaxID=241244 RepID=A0A143HFQ3_9BACL|nr:DUF2812 domain-containing protein [Rummeliibacillus stabekisii]AMX00568.1 hypothetical protein ATY39_14775 [Rummeliibacillus stabekisii]